MRLLFVGASWLGSSARSIREGLRRIADKAGDEVDEVGEDLLVPVPQSRGLRIVSRLLGPAYRADLAKAIISKCRREAPDALVVYKGASVNADVVAAVKDLGVPTFNIFPDYSPHAYGRRLRSALGEYDLVISTKQFHPSLWQSLYGYRNECIFIPHGYDPVHEHSEPQVAFDFDVGLLAMWRPQYHRMLVRLSELLASSKMRVAIGGSGWARHADAFPAEWLMTNGVYGAGYANWARRCKVMLAPLNTEVVIAGRTQPGDVDTTRTYELAAAHCFFIHRRTAFVQTLYDEHEEVPLFDEPEDLAELIQLYVPNEQRRLEMAAAAHRRAVPAYSTDTRAVQIAAAIRERL